MSYRGKGFFFLTTLPSTNKLAIIFTCLFLLFFLVFRLLERIDQYEKKLLDSSALQNSTEPLTSSGKNFAVAAELTCINNETGFPGKSLLSMRVFNNLIVNITDTALDLEKLVRDRNISAAMTLPEKFAARIHAVRFPNKNKTVTENSSTAKSTLDKCENPVAVVFHVFNTSKLFQSSTGSSDNLDLPPSSGLLLGQDLSVINTAVVSATLSAGLQTDRLLEDALLLFEDVVPLVRIICSI